MKWPEIRTKHLRMFYMIIMVTVPCYGVNVLNETHNNSSPYKHVYDACMHVWSDVREICCLKHEAYSDIHSFSVHAIIGQLCCITEYVKSIRRVSEDDYMYLSNLMSCIESDCQSLSMSVVQRKLVTRMFTNMCDQLNLISAQSIAEQ